MQEKIKEWWKKLDYWKKGIVIGTIYPTIIILLIILSNLPFVGFLFNIVLDILVYPALLLSNLFSYLILKLFYPGYVFSNIIINKCTTYFNCTTSESCYPLFKFCYLTTSLFFTFVIGWGAGILIGLIIDKLKKK